MSVFGPGLAPASDPATWEWIPPALGEFGTVGGLIPVSSFARCVRIDDGDADGGWGLAPILDLVVHHGTANTTTPDQARFAIWEGYGWETSTIHAASQARTKRFSLRRRTDPFSEIKDEFEQRKAVLAAELATLPMLEASHRSYFLLAGPLAAAATIHEPIPPSDRRVPDLWWPVDRAWFVGSDTDLTWTYVAGSSAFIQQIVAAWPGRARLVDADEPIA